MPTAWGYVGVDAIKLVVGMRASQIEKHGRHAAQRLTAALHRDDRVVERRRRWIGRDALDLGTPFGHADLEGRHEVFVAEAVERRVVVRQRAQAQQGIGRSSLDGNGRRRIARGRHRGGLGRGRRLAGASDKAAGQQRRHHRVFHGSLVLILGGHGLARSRGRH